MEILKAFLFRPYIKHFLLLLRKIRNFMSFSAWWTLAELAEPEKLIWPEEFLKKDYSRNESTKSGNGKNHC
jgi:hypothetical protein